MKNEKRGWFIYKPKLLPKPLQLLITNSPKLLASVNFSATKLDCSNKVSTNSKVEAILSSEGKFEYFGESKCDSAKP